MSNILLLGSKSASRKELLSEANISFEVIRQEACETECDWGLPLVQLVENIALHKMNHILLEPAYEGKKAFVLTADTLSQLPDGTIQGKPVDRDDAIAKIKSARVGSRLATAFCLDRKLFKQGQWIVEKRIVQVVTAEYIFDVPDRWIVRYLECSRGLSASNAIAVEGYGAQFFKQVSGSYSTIVGLPMFEVREALDNLGFFAE